MSLWCWFQKILPFDNSMGDYNHWVTDFIKEEGLGKEFKRFIQKRIKKDEEGLEKEFKRFIKKRIKKG